MRRREFLGGLAAAAGSAAAVPQPNIVFILADDLGWRDTGYNGSTFYETPHIDRLAKSALQFTNGYSASPVCTPTRAAIMTGKYPARLGLTSHLQGAHRLPHSKVLPPQFPLAMPLEETTIAELLRGQGYRTACIGKWHLGATGFLPKDQGFDVAAGGDVAGSTSSFFYPAWKSKIPLEGKDGDYLTDRLTDIACGFIEDTQRQPFFLYLPHFAVHTPIHGKPELVRKYEAKAKPGEAQNYADYAAMLESLDHSVGRVLDTLERSRLDQNTIVIFTSDNGGVTSREWKNRPITSNAPLRVGKGHVYEGGIRVPLLIRWPGVTKPGTVSDEPVLAVDYAPTLAAAAGVSTAPRMDGLNITPALRGKKLPRRALYWHYPHYSPQLGRPAAAVRQGDYKLIRFFEEERVELYNLRSDIGEAQDLTKVEARRAAEMNAALSAWLRDTGAKLPTPNPAYDAAREMLPGPPMGPVPEK